MGYNRPKRFKRLQNKTQKYNERIKQYLNSGTVIEQVRPTKWKTRDKSTYTVR